MIVIAINVFINLSYDFRNGLDSDINLGSNQKTYLKGVLPMNHIKFLCVYVLTFYIKEIMP